MESKEFIFYRHLYPDLGIIAAIPYDLAKNAFPELFNTTQISAILLSWESTALTITIDVWKDYYNSNNYIFYDHDKLTYRSTIISNTYVYRNQEVKCLTIVLSNDGFLYSPSNEHKIYRNNISRHDGSPYWVLLADEEVKNIFKAHIEFASKYFGKPRHSLKYKVFYNAATSRIDFKAFYDNYELNICYEPGYPVDDFKDEWLQD